MKKRTPIVWMAALLGTALLVLLCTDKPEMGFDSTPPAANEEVMSDGLRDSTAAANQGSNVIGFRKEVMPNDAERISVAAGHMTPPPVVVDQPGAKDNSDHIVGVNNMVQQPTMTMEATAYSYGCGTGDGLTATGIPVGEGVVAVDPNVIPYGSEVEIVGIGTFQAEDTGGAIRGNRIDIFMSDRGDCIRFGRQEVEVRILDHGSCIYAHKGERG